jgi:hypothetical protein
MEQQKQVIEQINGELAWLQSNPYSKHTAHKRYEKLKILLAKCKQLKIINQSVKN